jgi:hypothetical protein
MCCPQDVEAKLGTDLPSIGASILLAVGVVLCDYGVEGLLDIFLGNSVFGDVWCMVMVSIHSMIEQEALHDFD